jgi:hypothetical protein
MTGNLGGGASNNNGRCSHCTIATHAIVEPCHVAVNGVGTDTYDAAYRLESMTPEGCAQAGLDTFSITLIAWGLRLRLI